MGVAEAELRSAWTAEGGRPYATLRLRLRGGLPRLISEGETGQAPSLRKYGRGRLPNFRNLPC
jgi:hypothetical protein